jgi:hypothetical protein
MEEFTDRCERAEELIAFLYGEANEQEARNFERHMQGCVACKQEFASFGNVHNSMLVWRNEMLGAFAPASERLLEKKVKRSSAIDALREFFSLSPLWLKASVAAASVLFCVMAGLTLMPSRETPPIANSNQRFYSEEEVNRIVNSRVEQKVEELAAKATVQPQVVRPGGTPPMKRDGSKRRFIRPAVATVAVNSNNRRPLSKAERAQLAADLRLVDASEDTDLDLLGDRLSRPDE